jgi:hypothetical protein
MWHSSTESGLAGDVARRNCAPLELDFCVMIMSNQVDRWTAERVTSQKTRHNTALYS